MKRILFFCVIAVSTIVAGGFLKLLERNRESEKIHQSRQEFRQIDAGSKGVVPHIVERMVSSSQLWRPVQDQVKDTVVQIFSQVASVDLLQPYRTPNQGVSCGSGFFINDEGFLITNEHVVRDAKAVWIQIPSLGKRILDMDVVGVSPERDVALLRLSPESLEMVQRELGSIPFLSLGDSDLVRRADDVLALGYPLGQQSLKSTTGVISGREQNLIQISAPINPGSSGGPLLNMRGEVIGINSAIVAEAQNIGYIIPINDLKVVLNDLHKIKLLRKPFLGVLFNNATEEMVEMMGNPAPGGCNVVEVITGSTLDRAGVKSGDMIYEINGYQVDIYGEMKLPFTEDKISIVDYVSRLAIGDTLKGIIYRKGERIELSVTFDVPKRPAISEIYPGYEGVDYEIFGGMVVMGLSLNHIHILASRAPGLARYTEMKYQTESALVITHIFPNSQLYRSRSLPVGSTINEINGIEVKTLEQFRKAIKETVNSKFFIIRATDNVTRKSDNLMVVLSKDKIMAEEIKLSRDFKYPITTTTMALLKNHFGSKGATHLLPQQMQQEMVVAAG